MSAATVLAARLLAALALAALVLAACLIGAPALFAAETEVVVEGGTEVVRPPPERPLPSQAAEAGSRVVVTREQFQESQRTVADVVADQPGVTVTRGGDALAPAKATLRGSRTDQVLVIVDGVPQTSETDNPAEARLSGRQGVDLSQLDLSDVESVEIVRGAAGGLYGPGAAAGAIVIHTRRPREREFSIDHGIGSGGYADTGFSGAEPLGAEPLAGAPVGAATGTPAAGGGSVLTYAARNRVSDGRYVYFDPGAAATIGGAANPCADALGGGYFLRKCNRTEISTASLAWLQGAQRRIALDWQDYDRHGLGGIADPRPFGRERRTRTGLTYGDGARADSGAWSWHLSAVEVDGHRTDNEEVTAGVVENHHVEQGRAAEAWWTPWPAGSRSPGAVPLGPAQPGAAPAAPAAAGTAPAAPTGAAAASVPTGTAVAAATAAGQELRLGAGGSRLSLHDEFFAAQRDQGWLAAQWSGRGDGRSAEASARADAYSDVAGQGTWRLAATQALWRQAMGADAGAGSAIGVKASAGTGYRPPSLYELYDPGSTLGASAANPRLRPEQSQAADAGVYGDWPDRFYGELIAFQQDYRNTITLVANPASPALFQFQNLTQTRSTGVEALGTWKPTRGLTLSLNYTRTRAALLNNGAIDPRDNGNQVPGVPEERGSAELAWRRDRWSLYVKARTASERFVDTANSRALRPYTVWDAGVAVPLPRGFDLTFDARNLTNETYAEVDNYPAPGLQVFVTLRWRLRGREAAPPAAPPAAPGTLPAQAPRATEPEPPPTP